MAFWTMTYQGDAADGDVDGSFYWQDLEGAGGPGDMQGDVFGQFVDFGAEPYATTPSAAHGFHAAATMAGTSDSVLVDGQRLVAESTGSSGVSTADEFDLFSGPPAASHEIDPEHLTLGGDPRVSQQFEYLGRGSMSEADLSRLEGISLHSPRNDVTSNSHPSSPTPPRTGARRPNKFVEALSSTIRKATTLRKTRKPLPGQDRPGSPTLDHHQLPLRPSKQRGRTRAGTQQDLGSAQFIHGFCEDPFNEGHLPPLPTASSMQFYGPAGIDTPLETPGVKCEHGPYPTDSVHVPWQQMVPEHWTGQEQGWWELGMSAHGPHAGGNGEFANHHRNLASHAQHSGLPYEYAPVPDTSTAGLMIHMPQPRPPQPTVVSDLEAYLPPPPAPPSERPHRPPRAKSSGARHMSRSPMRKQRAPSTSPTPGQQAAVPRSRHSSGASVSSTRSSSGRLPGSMPGTPCSVRKRRSREVGAAGSMSADAGGDIGFVNFTPNDGSLLMTGVAPSGSSKTKARREKEAQDRRRRLSEAALKAVAAAGGDVDKLLEQGFAF
ncbi:Uncharacterized protein TCAP_05846 [Tolypocladium capitatum]|uniref:Uncharacterized protein n=1 Tax=Tolypocladium capitatum TaxID=45235 RepID=A0A2K3Q9J2_9HYPO|nr:Uncharacterized protein TCAP_05846 [Tolypocladium capitatum]